MDIKQGRTAGTRPASIIGLGCIAAILAAAPASANTACSLPAVQSLGVAGLTITAATDHPATATLPEYCELRGTVATDGLGAGPNSASIHADLPANWNGKFLTTGQGGFAGTDGLPGVSVGSPVARGYAVSTTDTGHQAGGTDARWALNADGSPAAAKIADYYYRAVHQVAVTSKALVKAFYGAGSISRSYFAGCSNGGRQAYNEATKFPDDFDGVIAGDPFLDIRALIAGLKFHKQNLQSANTFLPASKLPMIDAAVRASCDSADGVVDGLIQNPAKCSFNPNSLVTASCTPGDNTCLTQGQADTLKNYFTALRDDDGHVIYTGAAVSDLGGGDGMDLWSTGFFAPGQALPPPNTQSTFDVTAPEPWGNAGFSPASIGWQFVDHGIQYLVERNPAFNVRSFDANSPIGVESDGALKLFDQRTEAGDGDQPAKLLPFIAQDRKMLIYHGLSDPALPAFRTINHYEAVADLVEGGIRELQENVRLFLAPGMHHCAGGPGPNVFDTLTALEMWVEHGQAPDSILATHFTNNSAAQGIDRTMPLCAFPTQARYNGTGDVNDAASWSCKPNKKMLEVGPNGRLAGAGSQDDDHGDRDEHDDHR